ncbi:FAS1-like dehydratase domain-containing protein [Sphaerotilus mobilis]|uniref:3-methylfumaryl-CoA hydratase n=1 Tax=Sphaerotilus mobilis TaxID=47994 RepID=A0A4Q7LBA8_9BURK|nr:MaoC family dehydratase N-terminal domain-containing protein [Sphaerotilus mobilis]RZS46681.1 3-methylfumaryl-CoA hydratase [Sphaerotilus mobilis]
MTEPDKTPTPDVTRDESCTLASVRRVAAMLDQDPDTLANGQPLPRGWHFFLLAADTRRSALRSDGFPGLGVPMPDLGLPRLMLGSRTVSFHQDLPIGAAVQRSSRVRSVVHKTTASGPMAVVTLDHELRALAHAEPALVESQTYLLLPARAASAVAATPAGTPAATPAATSVATSVATSAHQKTVVPDDTLIYQYSALGFNSHRIHLDRQHAREVEGFPDLVVNGGLSTLLLTEFLRLDLGIVARSLKARHVAPLYCNRPVTLCADPVDGGWRLKALDDQQQLAVELEVSL